MELDKVRSEIKVAMIEGIKEVLSGSVESVRLHFVRPNDVVDYLETLGYDGTLEDMETNGWSWDMWVDVDVNGVWYTMSTDGHYNNWVDFSYGGTRNHDL